MKHRRHRTSAYRRVALVIMLVVATTLIDPLGWIFSVQLGPVAHAAFTCPNTWPLRRAFIAYDGPTAVYSGSLLDSLASRFEFSTSINTHNIGPLKQRRPSFYAIRYNSLSDNYVPPNSDLDEYNWFVANAATYGADPEDAYLHFWVDTEVQLEGQNIVIPGWQPDSPKAGATATTRAEARVPVYYKNLVRRAVNFSTPEIRLAHRAYNISLMQEPITGSDYWGGWMFDNAAQTSLRVSIVTSGAYPNGGQLGEHPTHTVMNSSAFISWYWYEGMGLFMKELREYVATNPPELGGRQAKVDPNIANVPWIGNASWEQGYVDFHPADMLLKEFEYSPTRNDGSTIPMTIYQKNLLAQAAGVEIMETGIVVLDRPPYLGVYTTDEAIMNTVSLHWVTRTPNVVMLGGGGNAVTGANWSTNNLRGVYDTDLGPALGDPYVLTTGTDPHGYAYTVYARQFSCGLSIVRERGAWSQDIGGPSDGSANTEVTVTLPDSYIPIDTDGNAFPAVTQATLRNGQGKMFISSSVADPPCTPLWTCTGWSACPSGSQTRSCTDQNNCGTNNGRPAETQSCTPPPCTENWSCGAWSACSNSTQSRSCTDGSACGTTVSRPALNQSCDSTAPAAVTDFRAT